MLCVLNESNLHLQELAAEAADYGITYGLEVVNRYESNILNTASQARLRLRARLARLPPWVCQQAKRLADGHSGRWHLKPSGRIAPLLCYRVLPLAYIRAAGNSGIVAPTPAKCRERERERYRERDMYIYIYYKHSCARRWRWSPTWVRPTLRCTWTRTI